jgi:hypothetical protein
VFKIQSLSHRKHGISITPVIMALQTVRFQDANMALNIARELENIITSWQLRGKVLCNITDNANTEATTDLVTPKANHIPCFPHMMNLIMK